MPKPLPIACLLVGIAAAPFAHAFESTSTDPPFTVLVPGLADVEASVATTTTTVGATPRQCAGEVLRALVSRPGMPGRDDIYRAPLSEKTFLVIYRLRREPRWALHAHLISSAGTHHCVDAHLSRLERDGEDEDDWRRAFQNARIVDTTRD